MLRPASLLVGCALVLVALTAAAPGSTAAPGEAAAPPGGAAAPAEAPSGGRPAGLNVTTDDAIPLGNTTVSLVGSVGGVGENETVVVWFEYRRIRSEDAEWRSSDRRKHRGPGRFHVNVTGLDPATGYEFRARAARSNGSATGEARPFKTRGTPVESPTGTPSPTPYGNPTPTEVVVDEPETPVATSVPEPAREPPEEEGDAWLGGLLVVLAWVGAVAVAAPLVLGGLLWLSGRGD